MNETEMIQCCTGTETEKAYAKLNISLDVAGRRDDGYHNMRMVMQTVSLSDDILVSVNTTGKVWAKMNLAYIPGDDRNLAVRAAKEYLAAAGRKDAGAVITVRKNIPVGAGMAGGSTDAAAVLRCMNRIFGNLMSLEELLKVAEKVGSDVPFCTLGGTAVAEGRGEVLTPLKPFPECTVIICKPGFAVSTPELFKALDSIRIRTRPDTAGLICAIEASDLRQICRRVYNVFEDVNDRRLKIVSEIKRKLVDAGALGAAMTGTGSAVFGVFEKTQNTENICASLKREYGFCVAAEPVGRLM